jgi:hypothetical protein
MEAPRSEKVRNRAHLRRILEDSLVTPEPDPRRISIDNEEDKSLKPKTYLIESNSSLKNIAGNGFELVPSEDNTLWNLVGHSYSSMPFFMYLDTLDPRYWVMHSVFYARESDAVIDSLVSKNETRLDYSWLSSDTLQNLGMERVATGFGISYSDIFTSGDEKSALAARVWGKEIPSVLAGLRNISHIKNQISLSSIAIKYITSAGHVNEDIFRHGKITAKGGDSVDNHLNLIASVKDYYSGLIRDVEKNYVIKYDYSDHYCTLQGSYSVIAFSQHATNLTRFAEVITSGSEPFRIWGVWRSIGENHIKIKGIDKHTNTPVELELMPDEMRVILGEGACGNIVMRLFTNIQASFDSNCTLKGLNDAYIISPHQTR